jgi:hypothetical protein
VAVCASKLVKAVAKRLVARYACLLVDPLEMAVLRPLWAALVPKQAAMLALLLARAVRAVEVASSCKVVPA